MNEIGEVLIIALITIFIFVFIGWTGYHMGIANKPTAMDVYQGKTTLEITYRDSIPIDSVVVFKEEQ